MQPHDTTPKLRAPRCPTCKKAMRLDGTCTNCAKPEVAEYYRLDAQGLRRCNICQDVRPLTDFALIRKGQARRRTICRACSDTKNKAYRDANTMRLKERQGERKQERHENYKRWYADPDNRRKLREYGKQWKRLNPDKDLEHRRKWESANHLKVVTRNQRRRARRASLPDNFSAENWQHAIEYFDSRCAYCGNQPGLFHYTTLSVEHFIPLSSPDCPGTVPENIIPACLSCNASRNDQDVSIWLVGKFGKRIASTRLLKIAGFLEMVKENTT